MEQDRQTLYEQYDQDNLNPEGGTFDFDDYQPEANSQQNSQQNTLGNGYSMEPSNGYDHQGYTDYSQEADVKIVRKESLQEVPFVINSLSNVFQQHEFGNINDQGLCTLIPLETQLHITYTWHIPRAELLEGEKMVSLPFGPREWSWQIIIYPSGVGETKDLFLGAFLRPIKNDTESAMDAWSRPLNHFVFRLKRRVPVVDELGQSSDDFAVQYTEEDFDGFSNSRTGWGFHEFCPLPIPFDELCSDRDTIAIEVQVVGPTVIKTSTIDYKEKVDIPMDINQPFLSSTFGPPSCLWQLQLTCGNQLGAHLCPVHSEFEVSMGSEWERSISTFTLKLCDPETNQIVISKSITGSFHLSNNTPMVGWEDFAEMEQLDRFPQLLASVHVTWDPAMLSEYTPLGKAKSALTGVTNQYQQCFEDMTFYQNENFNLQNANYEMSQLVEQLKVKADMADSLQQAQDLMTQETMALRERVKLLTLELQESRTDEKSLQMKEIQIATVKERISKVRHEMDNPSNGIVAESLSDINSIKTELASVLYQKAQLELQLAQAHSELQFMTRSSKDNHLMAPIPPYETLLQEIEIDPLRKIMDALDVCRNEITVGETALNEIQTKVNEGLSQIEKSGLLADISMVQCGLDVASATMYEVSEHSQLLQDPLEFFTSQQQLETIRTNLMKTRLSLEGISLEPKSVVFAESPQTELGPPPVVARHGGNRRKPSSDSVGEHEKLEKLDTFTNKMESIVELLNTKITSSTSMPALPVTNTVDDFESWTPNESKNSSLDVAQLQMLLAEVKRKRSENASIMSVFLAFSFLFFGLYSLVFVVCNPHLETPSPFATGTVCEEIVLPTWNQLHSVWHYSAEKVVLDYAPRYASQTKRKVGLILNLTGTKIKHAKGIDFDSPTQSEPIHPSDHNVPKTTVTESAPKIDLPVDTTSSAVDESPSPSAEYQPPVDTIVPETTEKLKEVVEPKTVSNSTVPEIKIPVSAPIDNDQPQPVEPVTVDLPVVTNPKKKFHQVNDDVLKDEKKPVESISISVSMKSSSVTVVPSSTVISSSSITSNETPKASVSVSAESSSTTEIPTPSVEASSNAPVSSSTKVVSSSVIAAPSSTKVVSSNVAPSISIKTPDQKVLVSVAVKEPVTVSPSSSVSSRVTPELSSSITDPSASKPKQTKTATAVTSSTVEAISSPKSKPVEATPSQSQIAKVTPEVVKISSFSSATTSKSVEQEVQVTKASVSPSSIVPEDVPVEIPSTPIPKEPLQDQILEEEGTDDDGTFVQNGPEFPEGELN